MNESDAGRVVLGDVASTGLLTAFCHAHESRSKQPLLVDPVAEEIARRLLPSLTPATNKLHRLLAEDRVREDLVVHLAMRARKFDAYARDFAARHPGGCVVNLGSGLDTRFFRVDDGRLHFYDLDLPEMIALKRTVVAESDRYHLIACSVLDHAWMDRVAAEQEGPFLFLAEGLFMYLPPGGVRALVVALQGRFPESELAFEAVNEAWLSPWLRWVIDAKLHLDLGIGEEATFKFGLRDAREVEGWRPGIRLLEEWSYLDEDEPRIGPLRHARGWDLIRRSLWTVRYALGSREAAARTSR